MWRVIDDSTPRDGTRLIVGGIGADGRWMSVFAGWHDPAFIFRADMKRGPNPRWVGDMGEVYGVEFTHWQPCPEPPFSVD